MKINQFVMVTTSYRGVFAGYLKDQFTDRHGINVTLTQARCAIQWGTTGGFLELAAKGPNENSLIGDVAPEIELAGVTSITLCTKIAEERWKSR